MSDKPPEKMTAQIPKVPDWAVAMTEQVRQIADGQRQANAALSSQISVVATDLRANTSLTADLSRKISDVAYEQKAQAGRIGVIEKVVFGSDPPPAPTRPMAHSVNEHDGEIAHLAGQIIAVAAKVDGIAAETEKQTAKLGLEPRSSFLTFVRNANTKDVIKVLTLVAAIIAAWKGLR